MVKEAPKVFQIVEYEDANDELRGIYDETMQTLSAPFVLNWFKCQGANPKLLRGNWEKVKGTLVEGTIPPLLKQLILYKVSKERNCRYCTFVHKSSADRLGRDQIQEDGDFAISENITNQYLPTSFTTAIRIVSKCALDPGATTDEDFEELYEEGFSVAEVQELMAQADMVNLFNTMSDVSGIPIDQELMNAL